MKEFALSMMTAVPLYSGLSNTVIFLSPQYLNDTTYEESVKVIGWNFLSDSQKNLLSTLRQSSSVVMFFHVISTQPAPVNKIPPATVKFLKFGQNVSVKSGQEVPGPNQSASEKFFKLWDWRSTPVALEPVIMEFGLKGKTTVSWQESKDKPVKLAFQ